MIKHDHLGLFWGWHPYYGAGFFVASVRFAWPGPCQGSFYNFIKFRQLHRMDGRQARIMKKEVSICSGFHPSLETPLRTRLTLMLSIMKLLVPSFTARLSPPSSLQPQVWTLPSERTAANATPWSWATICMLRATAVNVSPDTTPASCQVGMLKNVLCFNYISYYITCSLSDSPQIQQNNRFSTSYILKFYISWCYTNAQSFPFRGSCNVQALASTFPEASTRAAIPTCHTQSVCALITHDFLFASVCFSLPPCCDRIWPIRRNQRSLHR